MISPFHGRADLKRPRVCDFGASEKDYGYPLIGRPFIFHKALGSLSKCLSFGMRGMHTNLVVKVHYRLGSRNC